MARWWRCGRDTEGMQAFVGAGAGFLLAVLWFDLMFDVQVAGHVGAVLPDPVLGSIAAYYRRVTTEARPMNRLVAAAMAGTVASLIVELARGTGPGWMRWSSVVLAALAGHVGGFAGFWTHVLCEGAGRPKTPFPDRPSGAAAGDWFAELAGQLLAELRASRADASVWTWSPDDQSAGFVARRAAHE